MLYLFIGGSINIFIIIHNYYKVGQIQFSPYDTPKKPVAYHHSFCCTLKDMTKTIPIWKMHIVYNAHARPEGLKTNLNSAISLCNLLYIFLLIKKSKRTRDIYRESFLVHIVEFARDIYLNTFFYFSTLPEFVCLTFGLYEHCVCVSSDVLIDWRIYYMNYIWSLCSLHELSGCVALAFVLQ